MTAATRRPRRDKNTDRGRAYAARVPLHETFRIYVDDEGTLRTDHTIRLRSTTAVRLHYKLFRQNKP
jgi:hypothetical protein